MLKVGDTVLVKESSGERARRHTITKISGGFVVLRDASGVDSIHPLREIQRQERRRRARRKKRGRRRKKKRRARGRPRSKRRRKSWQVDDDAESSSVPMIFVPWGGQPGYRRK